MDTTAVCRTLPAVERVAAALEGVPRSAYSVPHVYPSAAPAYELAPREERERPRSRKLRLYVHVPFCSYRCTFCYFFVRVGASRPDMERYVARVTRPRLS
jgi:coproporphyrinogen III oxidase-like Fe-S oxidoreductase